MHPIKSFLSSRIIVCVLFPVAAACATTAHPSQIPTPTWVATADAQSEYSRAVSRWQSHHISDFEITVEIFSSLLPPPCTSKTTLVVTGNKLTAVHEIETPMPIPLGDGTIIYNPGCHEYERFTPAGLFQRVQDALSGAGPAQEWKVKFDPDYGYVTDLVFYEPDGESMQRIVNSDFKIQLIK